ncbi:hypothetical protein [Streptomyces chrestomyceticus]|uniref:hypothetical protein n=1 Tax=Streptomyces chrestomyceticus TaxID=68185 RepID=UPI0033DDE10E
MNNNVQSVTRWTWTAPGSPTVAGRRVIEPDFYRACVAFARANGVEAFEWSGVDRHGLPLSVVWTTWGNGDLDVYELVGRERLDGPTFERNCTGIVAAYGDEIDRALRITMEHRENLAIRARRRHRLYQEKYGTPLPGLLRCAAEASEEAYGLRTARQWLKDAREPGASPEKAIEFVVVHAETVRTALIRQQASERVDLDQANEMLLDFGPAREYLISCAEFSQRQVEALGDASQWLKRLLEVEVVRRSEEP